ncbi:MAG: transglutaminaseTgpA domain-containing protein [Haloarculaceae archaeon]
MNPTGLARAEYRRLSQSLSPMRVLALGSVALLLGAALRFPYHVVDVVGGTTAFLALVVGSLAAATALARVLRPRTAMAVGAVLLAGGLAGYLVTLDWLPSLQLFVLDTISLLTGRTVLQIEQVRIWVLAITPAPVFLTWYLALRRWYGPAVVVSGVTLAFFVLTGDASVTTTLLGVVGATAGIGLGDLERRSEPLRSAEPVAVFVALMIVVPLVVTVTPASAGQTLSPPGVSSGGDGGDGTVEGSLIETQSQISIQGSISLTPTVRFTVESDSREYWRVASYDRFTGEDWIRTGARESYGGERLAGPPGPSRTVEQTYRVESSVETMPGAWKPVRVEGERDVAIADGGGLVPTRPFTTGAQYTVESQVPVASPDALEDAGTDYPDRIEERYTQLPASTPDRVFQRTDRITANADNPYQTARIIEQWLENNREYSLSVDRPEGNIADAFLFEMDRGYCVYYATTMVTMLRSQDIPARFVVGYLPGERVDQDRWVVRGYDSHAWVEVYFPEHGWIRFDPTPAGPRAAAEQGRLEEARANDIPNVDTSETRQQTQQLVDTPTPISTTTTTNESDSDTSSLRRTPETVTSIPEQDGSSFTLPELPEIPSREEATLGALVVVGVAAAVRRSGLGERVYRAVWLRYQSREDPATDVERAFQRVMYLLGRTHRQRRSGETVREYLDAVDADPRARRVAEIRERARHAGTTDAELADEAVELADELVGER